MSGLIVCTVSPTPQFKVLKAPISGVLSDYEVAIGGVVFRDTGSGDTNGFYDYLRSQSGGVVGVRFHPFVRWEGIADVVVPGPGLRVKQGTLELFWNGVSQYDPMLADDQFCDANFVLISEQKRYAVTFGLQHLPDIEVHDILTKLALISPDL